MKFAAFMSITNAIIDVPEEYIVENNLALHATALLEHGFGSLHKFVSTQYRSFHPKIHGDSEEFRRWCKTFRITAFLNFSHRPVS